MAGFLAAEGLDVRVLTSFPHYPEWRFHAGRPPRTGSAVEHGVAVTRLRHRLPVRGSSLSRVVSELSFGLRAATARWQCPDAVVLVSPALFANLLLLPRLLLQRIPFAVWVQDLYGPGVRETGGGDRLGFAAGVVARLERLLLRRAAAVVAIHEQMATAVAELGVDSARVSVVRNWTHVSEQPGLDRVQVRRELGWSDRETVVLHTGNMGQKQDLSNVVEAARLVEREGIDMRFVLVGDGVDRPMIEEAAADVRAVQILPPQSSDLFGRLLRAADVLLVNEHPGMRNTALPSKLTSYFASGRPVLAATDERSATAAELRRSGAGERVDAGSPAALIDAVGRLVRDPDLVTALTRAARLYHRSELDPRTAARRFELVLTRIASKSGTEARLVRH